MFLGRHLLLLSGELLQGPDHAETRVPGFDDIIDVPLLRSLVGIVEEILVLGFLLGSDLLLLSRIFNCLYVFGIEYVDRCLLLMTM